MYEFFENCFMSTDFILDIIKDVPNDSDTKIDLFKSSSIFYPVKFYECAIQKHQRYQNFFKESVRVKLKEQLVVTFLFSKSKWLIKFSYFSGKVGKVHIIWGKYLIRGFCID